MPDKAHPMRAQRKTAVAILAGLALVTVWIILAAFHRRPFRPFSLTSADFAAFAPTSTHWRLRPIQLDSDEPGALNIMAVQLHDQDGRKIIVRLVHGYNMPMCMKIKGFKVEPIGGYGRKEAGENEGAPDSGVRCQVSGYSSNALLQIWRLASSTGARAIWATRILRAPDLSDTGIDVCSLPFPRVGIADEPQWRPQGIGWETLRHPWRWMRGTLRSAWNSARCDPLVFLRLKQPAWASDELLTLVASDELTQDWGKEEVEAEAINHAQAEILEQLREYMARRGL